MIDKNGIDRTLEVPYLQWSTPPVMFDQHTEAYNRMITHNLQYEGKDLTPDNFEAYRATARGQHEWHFGKPARIRAAKEIIKVLQEYLHEQGEESWQQLEIE